MIILGWMCVSSPLPVVKTLPQLSLGKTLRSLNLNWIIMYHDGVVMLCETLGHQDCALQMFGLEETQMLQQTVKDRNHHLTTSHHSWFERNTNEGCFSNREHPEIIFS
jgi:hypothetical protein